MAIRKGLIFTNRADFQEISKKGCVNRGNRQPIKNCMKKALRGEPVTVGFLGGSITQGSLASSPDRCYAYLVYDWWKQKFPSSQIHYVNAGVGGTTSQFGVARAKNDLLMQKPDFAVLEFSVNDDPTDFFEETYEGLVRMVLGSRYRPAVLLLLNVRYDSGVSAEDRHLKIGKAYGLPCVSMKACLYPSVVSGRVHVSEISSDGLHPNDIGHRFVADAVISCLEEIFEDLGTEEPLERELPPPITPNRYQNSRCLRNSSCQPIGSGFSPDIRRRDKTSDFFRDGWTASKVGDFLSFDFIGTGAAVQYRKSVAHPAPIAVAVLDGDESRAVKLDANFTETWGDSLALTTVAENMPAGRHRLQIRIVEAAPKLAADFYLASVIVSG